MSERHERATVTRCEGVIYDNEQVLGLNVPMKETLAFVKVCKIANANEQSVCQVIPLPHLSQVLEEVSPPVEINYSISLDYHQLFVSGVRPVVQMCDCLQDLLFEDDLEDPRGILAVP